MLPGRDLFWGPAKCCHGGCLVKCVSGFWELILKKGIDVEGRAAGLHKCIEGRAVYLICLVSQEKGYSPSGLFLGD